MIVQLITIGSELLNGHTLDSNAHWIARHLFEKGHQLTKKVTIPDDMDEILKALEEATLVADMVITTGGLGPTEDDITVEALATFGGSQLVFHEEHYRHIKQLLKSRGIQMTKYHKRQCLIPSDAILLENKVGTAAGLLLRKGKTHVVATPGVPHEMQYILSHSLWREIGRTEEKASESSTKVVRTVGISETALANIIDELDELRPTGVTYAFLPSPCQVCLRLNAGEGSDSDESTKYIEAVTKKVKPWVFGYNDDKLERTIGQMLVDRDLMLGTAESCTGGHLAHLLTSEPGASRFFKGSIIAYSDEVKNKLLHVPVQIIKEHGAVSEQVVCAMVSGLMKSIGVDVACAISGIAGPSGGTDLKPVGTVWIAVGDREMTVSKVFHFSENRAVNIKYASEYALYMIYRHLI